MLRNILAFLLAPFPAALIMAGIVVVRPRPGRGLFEHPVFMFLTVCVALYAIGLLFAVPIYVVLRRRGTSSLPSHAFTGGAIALAACGPLAAWGFAFGHIPARIIAPAILLYTFLGLLTGTTFWLIARPDRRPARRQQRAAKSRLLNTFE